MEEKYCTICGKLIVPHTNPQSYTTGPISGTFTIYFSNSSEPICFGHKETSDLPVGGLKDLQCHKQIPQAFYDAFEHEELQP